MIQRFLRYLKTVEVDENAGLVLVLVAVVALYASLVLVALNLYY